MKGAIVPLWWSWRSNEVKINEAVTLLKEVEKEQTRLEMSRRKEIIKIRAEIHRTETEKTIEKSVKLRAGSLKR